MTDLLKPVTPEYTNPIEQRRNAVTTFSQKLLAQLVEQTNSQKEIEPLQQRINTFLISEDEAVVRDSEFAYLSDVAHIAAFYSNHPDIEIPQEVVVTHMKTSVLDNNSLGLRGMHEKFLFVLPGKGAEGREMVIDAPWSHVYLGGDIKDFKYIHGKIRGVDVVLIGQDMARTNIVSPKTVALIGGNFHISHGEDDQYGYSGEVKNADTILVEKGDIIAGKKRETSHDDLQVQISCTNFILGKEAGKVGQDVLVATDNFQKKGGEFTGWFAYNGEEESWEDFHTQQLQYEQAKETNSSVYTIDLGKASAFIIRPKKQLPFDQYRALLKELNQQGALAFGRNEGTEVGGFFMQPKAVVHILDTLQNTCDIAIGIPTKGNSYLEWSWDAKVAKYGCEALVAAGRGLQTSSEKGQLSVWQLVSSNENSPEVIEGYKATQLRNLTLNESIQSARSVSPKVHEIVQTTSQESFLSKEHLERLYAVKVDLNDYTKTLLSLDKDGQEKFLQQTSTFLFTLENRLRDYTKQEGSGKIFFGEHTDALTFYLTNPHTIREVHRTLTTLLEEQKSRNQALAFKTVGIVRDDVTLTFMREKEGDSERVIYSDKPISDREWAEKEKIVKERDWQANKIFFEEK